MSEYERWETRFAGAGYAFGTAPNVFLASCRSILPASGRALAVADGEAMASGWRSRDCKFYRSTFRPPRNARGKRSPARAGSRSHSCSLTFTLDLSESAFDVVVEIFAQFSSPPERERKWAGMRKAIKAAHAALYRARKGR